MPLQRHQVTLHQIGLLRRMHADRHVRLAHRQIELRIVQQQRDRHVGIHVEELVQPRRQPDRAEGDRRRHLQPPGRLLLALGQQRLGDRQLGEHLAHGAVQRLALLGQDQAAGVAVEQRHLQRLLERRDLPRHRRLAEVQRVAGMREAAGLGHRVEDAQLVPVYHSASPVRRARGPGGMHETCPDMASLSRSLRRRSAVL